MFFVGIIVSTIHRLCTKVSLWRLCWTFFYWRAQTEDLLVWEIFQDTFRINYLGFFKEPLRITTIYCGPKQSAKFSLYNSLKVFHIWHLLKRAANAFSANSPLCGLKNVHSAWNPRWVIMEGGPDKHLAGKFRVSETLFCWQSHRDPKHWPEHNIFSNYLSPSLWTKLIVLTTYSTEVFQ